MQEKIDRLAERCWVAIYQRKYPSQEIGSEAVVNACYIKLESATFGIVNKIRQILMQLVYKATKRRKIQNKARKAILDEVFDNEIIVFSVGDFD